MNAAYCVGQRVADRVGEVDDRRAGLDRDAADARDERGIGAGRVLARELDLVDARGRVLDRPARLLEDLLRLEPELLLHVERARGEDDVDPRAPRAGERLPRRRRCRSRCARASEATSGALHGGRDGADAFEVAGRRAGEAGLDDVDAEPLELLGDLRLLVRLQRDARRLLAVAQRRIEDLDPAGHEHFLLRGCAEDAPVVWRGRRLRRAGACSCAPPRGGESR